jgi:dihydrofolate reductase
MASGRRLAIIVAAAENGVIGKDNGLPWHLPKDMAYFKAVTMGKPIVMGRKTFESIGKPLPGRENIVISRREAFQAEGVSVVSSLDQALVLAADIARKEGVEESVVIGGGEIYRAAIPRADRLYITEVHANVEGDVMLPEIDWAQWQETSRERQSALDEGDYDYSFVRYDRVLA